MEIISSKVLHSGQVRRYADSVYSYEVVVFGKGTDEEIWELCQSLKKAAYRKDGYQHNGTCGFPFGLNSFGSLSKKGENSYIYTVTYPYCD